MDEQAPEVIHAEHSAERGTLRSYTTGFVLSIVFTLLAYSAVVRHMFSEKVLLIALLGLAIIQFLVQIFYFLHIGKETKPRWRLVTLFLMIFFVIVVVLGSIWIMYNLNYRMSPEAINKYMTQQAGEGF